MKFRKYAKFCVSIEAGIFGLNKKQKFSKSDNPTMRYGILKFVKFQVVVYIRISDAI